MMDDGSWIRDGEWWWWIMDHGSWIMDHGWWWWWWWWWCSQLPLADLRLHIVDCWSSLSGARNLVAAGQVASRSFRFSDGQSQSQGNLSPLPGWEAAVGLYGYRAFAQTWLPSNTAVLHGGGFFRVDGWMIGWFGVWGSGIVGNQHFSTHCKRANFSSSQGSMFHWKRDILFWKLSLKTKT